MLLKNLVLSQVEMLPLKRHRLLQSLRRVTPGPLPLAQRLPAARGQDGGAKPGRASMGGAGWAGAGPSPHGPPPGELRLRRGGGARADRAGRWAWPRCGGGAGRWLGARPRRSPFPPRGRYAARAAAAPRSPQGRCRGAAAPAPGAQRALRRAGGRGERRRQGKRGARGDGCVQGAGGAKPKRPRAAAAGPGLGGARPPGAPGCGGARPGRPRRLRGGGGAGRPRGAAVSLPGAGGSSPSHPSRELRGRYRGSLGGACEPPSDKAFAFRCHRRGAAGVVTVGLGGSPGLRPGSFVVAALQISPVAESVPLWSKGRKK